MDVRHVPEQSPPTGSSADSGSYRDWAELTHDCLTNVLSRLTMEQLWTGPMLVCKPWLRACKDPCLHSTFDLETRFESSPMPIRWWSPEFQRRVDAMLRSVVGWSGGGLTVIRTRHCSDRALNLVAERCPSLQVLSIKSCPKVTDESMARIASHCTNLRELDISYCDEVSHESLVLIGRNCPNLKVLKRNMMEWLDPSEDVTCPEDCDSEAAAIGKFMPRLEHLEIRFSMLTAKGLTSICDGCLDLMHLDLLGCAYLTRRDIVDATSKLKNLKDKVQPNFYIPRSVFRAEMYERLETDVLRIWSGKAGSSC
ncbi:F-box protein SKIP1-like [Rhodamnia argentea]|uniref:F-box protein SKIP1-like n=1 Tax=Rhodamnia argentea TaxID=178133 RepID=A0A8B8NLV1_9MYRT|nr:F-box protein SKIP1-like [Rhodamnia argentea]